MKNTFTFWVTLLGAALAPAHAAEWGIDPDRIVASGGSAGGHLAACTAVIVDDDKASENATFSPVPNALVLFNPVLDTTAKGYGAKNFKAEQQTTLSPCHHVRPGVGPTIIFHGRADTTVPYATVEKFAEVMQAAGNRCELVGYEGQPHGFFNKSKMAETLGATDAFLVSLGYLPAAH